jgi:hypothetical protein
VGYDIAVVHERVLPSRLRYLGHVDLSGASAGLVRRAARKAQPAPRSKSGPRVLRIDHGRVTPRRRRRGELRGR